MILELPEELVINHAENNYTIELSYLWIFLNKRIMT